MTVAVGNCFVTNLVFCINQVHLKTKDRKNTEVQGQVIASWARPFGDNPLAVNSVVVALDSSPGLMACNCSSFTQAFTAATSASCTVVGKLEAEHCNIQALYNVGVLKWVEALCVY